MSNAVATAAMEEDEVTLTQFTLVDGSTVLGIL